MTVTELQGVTCHIGSHNVTCQPTKETTPCLNSRLVRLVLDLPIPEAWKAGLT